MFHTSTRIECQDNICMASKYDKAHTSSAVGRSFGSNDSSLCSNLSAKGSVFGNFSANGTGCFFFISLKYFLALSFRTCILNALQITINNLKGNCCHQLGG